MNTLFQLAILVVVVWLALWLIGLLALALPALIILLFKVLVIGGAIVFLYNRFLAGGVRDF